MSDIFDYEPEPDFKIKYNQYAERRHPMCPYCDLKAELRDSARIYGKSYGMVWVCPNYPDCDAFVGCYKESSKPLGTLANKELREARKQAHSAFDRIWETGQLTRQDAYDMLSIILSIPSEECHIGMFDLDNCKRVCDLFNFKQT